MGIIDKNLGHLPAKLGAFSENYESPHDSSINYPSAEENRGHELPSKNWASSSALWSSLGHSDRS